MYYNVLYMLYICMHICYMYIIYIYIIHEIFLKTENKICLLSKYSTCLVPLPNDFKTSQHQEENQSQYLQFKYYPKTPPENKYLERFGSWKNSSIYSQWSKLSWKHNKSAKKIHTSNYVPTRQLKGNSTGLIVVYITMN